MLDALTQQLSPATRPLADRSITAAAGALFGLVMSVSFGMLGGFAPFSLALPMVLLYSSAIPLSIAGFLMHFAKNKPKLPILATLWFVALFVPGMFFSELLFGSSMLDFGVVKVFSYDLVGLRAIAVAALSGLVFMGIKADGSTDVQREFTQPAQDWSKRHEEAVARLAQVDVELRRSHQASARELAMFDRRLAAAVAQDRALNGRENNGRENVREEVVFEGIESEQSIEFAQLATA